MTILTLAGVAVLGFAAGCAVVWIAMRRRAESPAPVAESDPVVPIEMVPYTASVEEIAAAVDGLLGQMAKMKLVALYAGREGSGTLDARWRARGTEPAALPLHAPETLLVQLQHPKLVDAEELVRGLRPGLPPADPKIEASQLEAERIAEKSRAATALRENPFELEDGALTDGALPSAALPGESVAARSPLDEATLAARLAVMSWSGPFDWRGLLVARPFGADRERGLALAETAADALGQRLAVHCEVVDRGREAIPPAPVPVGSVTEPQPDDRLRRAEIRMAEALQTPRREPALARATVGLLAEGLAPDRCYAVEIEGLHTRPIEHERRTEAASSAIGLDFGQEFLRSLRARSGSTIKAIMLDANHASEMIPEDARERLGSVSRMLLPVLDKGRIVVVFVAEWIDMAKRWSEQDIAFAERLAARAAVARERLLQYEAIAEQAAHARASQEQMEEALEQLQSLVAAVPEGLVGLDGEGRITFANRAAAELFGHGELELMGRSIVEVVTDLDGDPGAWERVVSAGSVTRLPSALVSERGSIDLTVVPGVASGVCERLVTMVVRSRQ